MIWSNYVNLQLARHDRVLQLQRGGTRGQYMQDAAAERSRARAHEPSLLRASFKFRLSISHYPIVDVNRRVGHPPRHQSLTQQLDRNSDLTAVPARYPIPACRPSALQAGLTTPDGSQPGESQHTHTLASCSFTPDGESRVDAPEAPYQCQRSCGLAKLVGLHESYQHSMIRTHTRRSRIGQDWIRRRQP